MGPIPKPEIVEVPVRKMRKLTVAGQKRRLFMRSRCGFVIVVPMPEPVASPTATGSFREPAQQSF